MGLVGVGFAEKPLPVQPGCVRNVSFSYLCLLVSSWAWEFQKILRSSVTSSQMRAWVLHPVPLFGPKDYMDPMDCSPPTRLLWAWNFPGKHIGVGCNFLLQKIFLTQGLNPWLLHYRLILYCWAAGKAQSVSSRFQTGNLQHGEANVITTMLWKGGR